jgi:hypothetical protein
MKTDVPPKEFPTSEGLSTSERTVLAFAVLALALAALPWMLSVPLALAVSGTLVLQALHPPSVMRGGGLWLWPAWAAWWLALAACPAAIEAVAVQYSQAGASPLNEPRAALADRMLGALFIAHLVVSVIATWSVVFLLSPGRRWIAWGAILVIGFFTLILTVGAGMATTGTFL